MSTSTVALTIEMPSLDASLSWNALESLVVGMSHEVPARALALALDDAQERLLQEACGPRWAPVRGRLAPFACPGCGPGRTSPARGSGPGRASCTPPPGCLLYTSPSPRDGLLSRMPSSA